ncbi:hypothetical protein B9T28_08705 [Acinetobacter silvestris]|uniref:Uncharacterized protein n=1 Tax=Acinetobacter silvestris TaxID=1977882 RepID=A0A1Y3CEJ9_9GAMM|nr:hypothetical protein B9T28_08705 [Acinetobacter silvestris]
MIFLGTRLPLYKSKNIIDHLFSLNICSYSKVAGFFAKLKKYFSLKFLIMRNSAVSSRDKSDLMNILK